MNKIKPGLLFFILFTYIFTFSCTNNKKEFYENGNLKAEYQITKKGILEGNFITFYENGNIKSIDLYKNNIKVDSTIVFDSLKPNKIKLVMFWNKNSVDSMYSKNYENDNITSEGHLFKSKKTGKWKFYKDKKLYKVMQYVNINGMQYLNQGWFFDKLGDTLREYGNNYKFDYLVTEENDQNVIDMTLNYNPLIAENSTVILLYNENLKKNFLNKDNIFFDTIFFHKNKAKFKYVIRGKRKTKVDFNFRAIIKEYAHIVPKDSISYKERFVYLDERISNNK